MIPRVVQYGDHALISYGVWMCYIECLFILERATHTTSTLHHYNTINIIKIKNTVTHQSSVTLLITKWLQQTKLNVYPDVHTSFPYATTNPHQTCYPPLHPDHAH